MHTTADLIYDFLAFLKETKGLELANISYWYDEESVETWAPYNADKSDIEVWLIDFKEYNNARRNDANLRSG